MKTQIMAWVLVLGAVAHAEDYLDAKGRKVTMPLGALSFADEVVSFEVGKPAPAAEDSNAQQVLGEPNYNARKPWNTATLGCGGKLSLRFTDNALVDGDGPDLYVFEVGPQIEPTSLSLSIDGEQWVDVGRIAGGSAAVDIHRWAKPGEAFHYVRLTDEKLGCRSRWPGADIDAVGAIGGGLVISLQGAVLFDVDKFALKPAATAVLRDAADKIAAYPGAEVVIDGHTDSDGTDEHNQVLSENRARAVRDFFVAQAHVDAARIRVHGYGEARPIFPNDTPEGKEKNRRVEIIAIPVAQ